MSGLSAAFAPGNVLGSPRRDPIVNAMTIDVEDYFQVSAFDTVVSREDWHARESRVCANTERLLEILDDASVTATFFVLGWVAERFPKLVRSIAGQGHEIASHGFEHRLVYEQTPQQFRDDIRRARLVLESVTGMPVVGYRAPSYSIIRESMWALDVLIEEGYLFDSSIYPIRHDRYGIPDAPRHVHQIVRQGGSIWEVPGSTVRMGGLNLPIGGGGYFRLLPYAWTKWGIRRVNAVEGRSVVFYLHPWEIDPAQPRLPGSLVSRFRHYRNLDETADRLRALCQQFQFGTISDVLTRSDILKQFEPVQAAPSDSFARASA
jgi:polysaccharide deacetylase family protein (PEP-CTERM system associated)